MDKFNEILGNIYDQDFNIMGYSVRHQLSFIVRHNSQVYLVLLMSESSFVDDKFLRYQYAIYSLTDSRCVIRDTKEYKQLLMILPKINNFTLSPITVGPNEMFDFYKSRDSVIDKICISKQVTETLKPEYFNYLNRICEIYEDKHLIKACNWFKKNC